MDSVVEKKKKTTRKRSSKPKYSKETYLKWYELMLRIRRFEERALMMYGQQKFAVSVMFILGRKRLQLVLNRLFVLKMLL